MSTNTHLLRVGNFRQLLLLAICTSIIPFETLRSPAQCAGPAQWKQIGPAPLIVDSPIPAYTGSGPNSGHIEDIAIDPSGLSDQTIYVATAAGGIWKTVDGGSTWTPKTDGMPSVFTSAVALDPANSSIVYAGTGGDIYHGLGIYKSLDGGNTWTILGTNSLGVNIFRGASVFRIVIPSSSVLLVASSIGLYRSVDGGQSFGANAPLFNDWHPIPIGPGGTLTNQISISGLKADTGNPSIIYVAVTSKGIFKSVDGGASFPTPNFLTAANGATDDLEIIRIAQSTSPNTLTMYASVALNSSLTNGLKKLFRADLSINPNTAQQWREICAPGITGQDDYDQTLGVDPQNADRVYVGNDDFFMATNDANPLISIGQDVHYDNHALTFSPPSHFNSNPTRLYVGNDGGIAYTSDAGSHWAHPAGATTCSYQNGALATIGFYQIDMGRGSTANNAYNYGASQDNGLEVGSCPGTPWHQKFGGDGYEIAVDPLDPTHAIGLSDGGIVAWGAPPTGLPSTSYANYGWQNGIWFYFDPNGHVAYAATGTNLFRSTDQGYSFTLMHTFPQGLTGWGVSVAMSTASSTTAWVGLSDGTVAYTSDANLGAGSHWTPDISIPGAPSEGPCGLAVDPGNSAIVVVAYPNATVLKTTNYGVAWTDITDNLPYQPLRAVIIDPNHSPHSIIVAGDAGVLLHSDAGGGWQPLAAGLPPAEAMSLVIDYGPVPSLIRVGTYDRSAFELAYDRQYVDWRNNGTQDGTREHPFKTVTQAVNAPANGDARYIVIQAGDYPESPLTITQCGTLTAINGSATIH